MKLHYLNLDLEPVIPDYSDYWDADIYNSFFPLSGSLPRNDV